MTIEIKSSMKFSCYAFHLFACSPELPEELELDECISVLRKPPVGLNRNWREWLGSLEADAIESSDFVLLATAQSKNPELHDEENVQLTKKIDYLLDGLLLQGVPMYERGFSLSGANVHGEIHPRRSALLEGHEPSYGMPGFLVGVSEVTRAMNLSMKLHDVGSMQPNWQRLRRGLRALFKGSRETNKDGERLHEFVRAVEALIKPRIGRSKADFVHRAQTFAMASPDTMKALGDIYEIRNCVEHLNSPLDAVTGTEEQRIERVNWRTRQADCLSRFALAHILESNDLLEIFMTDSNIDDFWSKQDHERLQLWGTRIDMMAMS